MENSKLPIATPKITLRPKSSTAAIAKPIAGKKGSILISVTNINKDNLAIIKYKALVLTIIFAVVSKYVRILK